MSISALVVWSARPVLISYCPINNASCMLGQCGTGVQHACLSAQDLSRLGRDLNRTVLVDDTPLAFLRQPDNGIPIFNFRSGPSDAKYFFHTCAWTLSGQVAGVHKTLLSEQEDAMKGSFVLKWINVVLMVWDLCRGDVDDRVLMEAILPLLQGLASSADVRPVLHRRFDMRRWFLSQVSAKACHLPYMLMSYHGLVCRECCHWAGAAHLFLSDCIGV